MTLDLTQFHDAFFEESFEALDSMESALLKLDLGAPDAELINTIFRVAHSIKGGSATFGFSEIASFTHSLETLLDELRSNKLQVTSPTLDLLLKSVDAMRDMLRAVQTKSPIDSKRVAELQRDAEQILVGNHDHVVGLHLRQGEGETKRDVMVVHKVERDRRVRKPVGEAIEAGR